MAVTAWPDAERVDRHRLAGLIAYCPVCRRPSSQDPMPPTFAFERLARHLRDAHDPYFVAMLRIRLAARPQEPPDDPFYPVDEAP